MTYVRVATSDDGLSIADVQCRAWRQDYIAHLPPSAIESLEPVAVAKQWGPMLEPTCVGTVLVAVTGDSVGGFLAYLQSGRTAVIDALVIDPDQRRRGHASRLMSAFADLVQDAGAMEATMWCPGVDAALHSFLRSCGWGPDGATRTLADGRQRAQEQRFATTFLGESPALAGS